MHETAGEGRGEQKERSELKTMHRPLTTSSTDDVLRFNLPLLLIPFFVLGRISAALSGENAEVHHHLPSAAVGSDVEEIQQEQKIGTWDDLSLCIKVSKEERALERWLLCVEGIASPERSGIPLSAHESEAIEWKNEVASDGEELSRLEKIRGQESIGRGPVELGMPNDQLQLNESSEPGTSQLQNWQGRKGGAKDGDLGPFEMDDLSGNEGANSFDSIDQRVGGSRNFGITTVLEENGPRGFVAVRPDANPSATNDGANDSEGPNGSDFSSYRADQNEGSASGSRSEVDQVFADFKSMDSDLPENAGKDIPVLNSVTTEALNSCSAGSLSSQDGPIAEGEDVSITLEQHPRSTLEMRDAITSAAVVGLLTLMLRAQRGRSSRKLENEPEISTAISGITAGSSTSQIQQKFPIDTQRLSQPLGMAVAQVFYEVLEQNGNYSDGSLSAESLSNLLESALKESLMPVLGNDRFDFVEKFRDSFTSTYRTRATVRRAYRKAEMRQTETRQFSGKSWRGSLSKLRRESQKEQYSSYNVKRHSDDQEVENRSMKLRAAHEAKTIPIKNEDRVSDSSFRQGFTVPASFFSTTKHEQDGRSDCTKSSKGHCSGGVSLCETPPLAFCREENNVPLHEEDCSQDEPMYSADDSGESEEWIVLEGRDSGSGAMGREVSLLDDGPSSYPSVEHNQRTKDHGFATTDLFDMSQVPQSSSCLAGGVGSSVGTRGEVGSFRSPGSGTARLDLSDSTLEVGNCLDFKEEAQRIPQRIPVRLINDRETAELKRLVTGGLIQSDFQFESPTTSEDSRSRSLGTPERNLSIQGRRRRGEGSLRRSASVDSGGSNDRITPPKDRADVTGGSGLTVQDALVLPSSSSVVGFKAAVEERYDLLERSVAAQEQHNRLLAWDLQRRSQGLAMKEEHLHLQFESNSLMKENVELSRMKAEFKENELQDRKLNLAYSEFSRTCADQLVAGLCVMLVVLGFSFWKFSYDRLTGVVTVCKPPVRETQHQSGWLGTNWMYNSLNAVTYQVQAFTCEITKAGRMVVGLIIIAFVTSSLLRRSVTSSSQAMPATIIVVVLGGICGFAGKISVDSLGGSGFHWLVLWECLCLLHAFATCFTPLLYHLVNGPPPRNYFETSSLASRISHGVSRFIFHTILVFLLPLMAGLLPFASLEQIMQMFLDWWSPGTFHGKYRVHV